MVSGCTKCPGRITILSTRAAVCAGIQWMSSGTKVPRPRTSRSIGPRFTVSGQIVEPSTDGAAGFRRDNARVTPAQSSTATVTYAIRLIFLARAFDGLWISIVFVHLENRTQPALAYPV